MNFIYLKIIILLSRFIGILAGVVLLIFALAMVFLPDESGVLTDRVYDIWNAIFYISLTICLIVPNSFIKSAFKARIFFHIFLTLGIIFTLTSIFFSPPSFGVGLAIIILLNVWVSYIHYQKLILAFK